MELYFFGEFGRWGIAASDVLRAVSQAAPSEPITAYIHSNGGSVQEGAAIIDVLNRCKNPKNAVIVGNCASMATVVASAAFDKVSMSQFGTYMTHRVRAFAEGDAEDLENTASLVRQYDDMLVEIFARKTGKTPDYVRENYLKKTDTFLTASTALADGFIDEITALPNISPPDGFENMAKSARADWYAQTLSVETFKNLLSPQTNIDMDLKDLQTKLADVTASLERETAITKTLIAALLPDESDQKIFAALKADPTAAAAFLAKAKKPADAAPVATQDAPKDVPVNHVDFSAVFAQFAKPAADDRSSWTLLDWISKDPQGAAKLEKEQPEKFHALK